MRKTHWKELALCMALLLALTGCGGGEEAVVSEAADAGTPETTDAESAEVEVSETLSEETDAPAASTVYFTADISPEGLVKAYEALNWTPTGKTAVKLSTGEPPNSNYLRPELIADLVNAVDGTIVECNTAYGGSRASTAMHKQVAEDHGFTAIANFDLMDEDGEKDIPVTGGALK